MNETYITDMDETQITDMEKFRRVLVAINAIADVIDAFSERK